MGNTLHGTETHSSHTTDRANYTITTTAMYTIAQHMTHTKPFVQFGIPNDDGICNNKNSRIKIAAILCNAVKLLKYN